MHPCSFDMICWFKQRYTLSLLVKQARQHTCFSACNIPAELDLISMLWQYIEVPSTNSAKWCVCADNNTGTCFPKTPRPNIFTKSQFDWEVLCERRRAWIRINLSLMENCSKSHEKMKWRVVLQMAAFEADIFGAAVTFLFLRFTEQIWKHHDCQSINMFSLVM